MLLICSYAYALVALHFKVDNNFLSRSTIISLPLFTAYLCMCVVCSLVYITCMCTKVRYVSTYIQGYYHHRRYCAVNFKDMQARPQLTFKYLIGTEGNF